VTRTTQSFSDPQNLTTNQKSIPGAVMLNVTNVRNSGPGPADSGSIVITEAIPVPEIHALTFRSSWSCNSTLAYRTMCSGRRQRSRSNRMRKRDIVRVSR
jgi:hypothetical protein